MAAMDITPKDVIKVLEGCINFLEVELLAESLNPSAEMAREENVNRLTEFVNKLKKMDNFTKPDTSPKTKPLAASLSKRLAQDIGKAVTKKDKKEGNDSSNNSSTSDLPPPPSTLLDDTVEEDENYEVPSGNQISKSGGKVPIEEEEYEVPERNLINQASNDGTSVDTDSFDELQQKVKTLEKCSPEEMKRRATFSGYLLKHKKRLLTVKWHKRFCVLVDEFLFYYKSDTDKKEQGYIILPCYTMTVPAKDKGFVFVLESEDKGKDSYSFQADAIDAAEKWQKHIQAVTCKGRPVNTESNGATNARETIATENESSSEGGSGSARVEDICDGAIATASIPTDCDEIYDDVANNAPPAEIYDDVAASREPNNSIIEELYDDIAAGHIDPVSTSTMNPAKIPQRSSAGSVPVPPSVDSSRTGDFSMDNVYMGMFDCYADDEQDLQFNRGDIMYVLDKIDTHWWLGYLNGKVGLVPSNHLVEAFVSN